MSWRAAPMFGTLEAKMTLLAFGTFMTVNAIGGIVIASILAHYSDTHFSRRSMLLVGSLAGACGYVGYAYLRNFFPLLLVGTLILGTSSVTFSQLFAYARELLVRSKVPAAQRAFYINACRMFIALAWTVGPAVAAWVMMRFSYRGLFLCAAADFFLFACVVWRYVPAVAPIAIQSRSSGQRPLLALLARGDVLAHVMAFVLITASTTIGMMNLPLFILKTLHGDERNVGLAYSVAPIFELPLMLYFGWLATKHAPDRIIRLGMAFGFAYYVTLVLVAAPWHVYVCQVLSAATIAIIAGVAITYFQRHLPHHPGTATNLYANAQRVGSTAGYFIFVFLVSRFVHRAVFEACAGFALVALGLMFVPLDVPPEESARQNQPGLPVASSEATE